jgi:hypothetical protein
MAGPGVAAVEIVHVKRGPDRRPLDAPRPSARHGHATGTVIRDREIDQAQDAAVAFDAVGAQVVAIVWCCAALS